MKGYLISLLFIVSCIHVKAQVQIKTVDRQGNPVQWTSVIWSNNAGLVTNENGLVTIANMQEISDTLFISNVGYKTIHYPKSRLSQKSVNTIVLEEEYVELPPVIAGKKWNVKTYGCERKRKGICILRNFLKSIELGIKISGYQKGAVLKDFSVYISNESDVVIPFRIKIYEVKENGYPGRLLINKSIIISNYKRGGWNKFDLSNFEIYIPNDGFFIGIETLPTIGNQADFAIGAHNWGKGVIIYSRIENRGFGITKGSGVCKPMMRVTLMN